MHGSFGRKDTIPLRFISQDFRSRECSEHWSGFVISSLMSDTTCDDWLLGFAIWGSYAPVIVMTTLEPKYKGSFEHGRIAFALRAMIS